MGMQSRKRRQPMRNLFYYARPSGIVWTLISNIILKVWVSMKNHGRRKNYHQHFFLKWHELDNRQQDAATKLTYDESTWDNKKPFKSFTQKHSNHLTATKTRSSPRAAQNQNHTKNFGDNNDDDDDDDDSEDEYQQTCNHEEEDDDDDADDKGP